MKRASMKLFPLFALLLLAFGAGACSSYSYYDLDLKLGSGFDPVLIGGIQFCHLSVDGAASDDIEIPRAKCMPSNGDIGTIEYSTFADSGNITFTLKLYGYPETSACQLGQGSTTLPAGSAVRKTGTVMATAASPTPSNCGL